MIRTNTHKTERQEVIRVVLLDDEQEASENLKNIICNYCENGNQIQVVGVAQSAKEAELLIHELQPDALFVDIEMPVENGFQFLERIAPFSFEIIFVTAYDEFALKAFKLNALDYILKPISIAEIQNVIAKLKERMAFKQLLNEKGFFRQFSDDIKQRKETEAIRLRTVTGVEIIDYANIIYIEALGAYSKFHFMKNGVVQELVMSYSIKEYEQILPPGVFFRIHKSFLVNCNKITEYSQGVSPSVCVDHHYVLAVSRRRQSELRVILEQQKQSRP